MCLSWDLDFPVKGNNYLDTLMNEAADWGEGGTSQTEYTVPSTKYQVPSTKYQVPIPQFLNFSRLFLKTFIKSQGYTSPNIEVISTFLYQALAMQTTHRSTSTRSTKMREDLFIGAIIRKLATIIATIIKMWLSSI